MKKIGTEKVTFGQMQSFKHHKQNRAVNKTRVAKIKSYIKSHGYEGLPAIIVSGTTLNILDGQHRHAAFMELMEEGWLKPNAGAEVKWNNDCKTSADEQKAIVVYNASGVNWKARDYVNSHEAVNDNYKRLREFARSHELLVNKEGQTMDRAALAVIFGRSVRGRDINSGNLICTEEDIQRGEKTYAEISQILKYLKCEPAGVLHGRKPTLNIEEFTKAWCEWRGGEGAHIPLESLVLEFKYRAKTKYNKMPMSSKTYFTDILRTAVSDIYLHSNPLRKKETAASKKTGRWC